MVDSLIIDSINISSLRQHLETGKKCTISTEEWLKVLDILEKLYQDNDELSRVNLRLLHRLEVDDKDVNLVYQLEKELDNLKSEWYTAIVKGTEYEQAFKSIRDISGAIVNGTHFADSSQDLSEHFKMLNQQILDIIDKTLEV